MVGLLLASLLLAAPQGGPPRDSVAARLASAQAAVERGAGDSAWAVARARALGPTADRMAVLVAGAVGAATFHPEAEAFLRRVLPDDPAHDDLIAVEAALWLGELRRRASGADAADPIWRRAATAAARLDVADRRSEALVYLAGSALRRGDPAAAMALLDSAERMLPPGYRIARARAACQRASALAFLSRHAAADSAARVGARLALEAKASRDAGRCLAILGSAQAQRNHFFAAADTLALAASALRDAHDERTLAAVLQWRGYVLRQLTRLGEADATLREAITIARTVRDPNVLGWSYLNLGQVAWAFGDLASASEALANAVTAFAGSGDAWGEHSTLLALADVRRDLGGLADAERDTRRVLEWARTVHNADLQFGAWYRLALQSEAAGDLERATARADSAGVVAREASLTGALSSLAYLRTRLLLRRGHAREAATRFRRYLASVDSSVHARRYAARARLAEALVQMGDTAAGGRELEHAMQELDAWRGSLDTRALRREVFAATTEDPDADLGIATVIAALASSGDVRSAFRLSERRRARDLVDRLARIGSAGPASSDAAPHAAPTLIDLGTARATLDHETALVSFVTGRGNEPTTVIVGWDDGARAWRLAPIDSLAPAVSRLHALLVAGEPVPHALTRTLAVALVAPWLAELPARIRRLIIVPDDVLHHVPFALLPTADGAPLAERWSVAYAPSASVLGALHARGGSTRSEILALADPPVPMAASARRADGHSPSRDDWQPLPGARREVRAIARRVSGVHTRVGERASEALVKARAADAGVIHIASHAVVDEHSPLRTFVLLAGGDGEDGLLTANEIEALTLDADLVVLSACGTAGGSLLAGEGVQGLTAPLLAAGARAVVASRWDVDDRATARLMEDLYAAMLAGAPVADALNAAKRAARRRGAPPNVWAAFSVFGDPTARPPLHAARRVDPLVLVAIGGAAVLALGVIVRRRVRV